MWRIVKPVLLIQKTSDLCRHPYPLHPNGCPNWGKRSNCPPLAPPLFNILAEPIYAIWNIFAFGIHVERMRKLHPLWSDRQVRCCLYWQGTARKALKLEVVKFLESNNAMQVVWVPEACGVNVTVMMQQIGERLEWPPEHIAYQVVLAGKAERLKEQGNV